MGSFSTILSIFAYIFGKDYSFMGLVEKIGFAVKTFVVSYVTKWVCYLITPTALLEVYQTHIMVSCAVVALVGIVIAGHFQSQLTSMRVRFGFQEDPAVVVARLQAVKDAEEASASTARWLSFCGYATAAVGGAAAAIGVVATISAMTSDKPKPKEIK